MSDQFTRRARDSEALRTRTGVTAALAERDLEAFMLKLLELKEGERVLDIGCGRGKQLFVYAGAVGPEGRVLGIDASPGSIEYVTRMALEGGLNHVAALELDMDALPSAALGPFDAVVSAYALYYAQRPADILTAARKALRQGGRALVVAPTEGNNREFFAILSRYAEIPENIRESHGFLPLVVLPACRRLFDTTTFVSFPNVLTFDSPEPLLEWWRSSTFFHEEALHGVTRDVEEHFQQHGVFKLHKEAGAVLARVH